MFHSDCMVQMTETKEGMGIHVFVFGVYLCIADFGAKPFFKKIYIKKV